MEKMSGHDSVGIVIGLRAGRPRNRGLIVGRERDFSLISFFRRDVDEFCALLGYYAASSDSPLPTFRELLDP
jgi:hypothetical protein